MSKDDVEINASINRMYANGGGIVQLTEGTFYIDEPIILKSNVSLVGRGANTIIIQTSYVSTANFVEIIGALDATNDVFNTGIKYISFVSTSSSLSVIDAKIIKIRYATYVSIKNCIFNDSKSSDSVYMTNTTGLDFVNNVFDNCLGRCVYAAYGSQYNIIGNQITNSGDGVWFDTVPSCLITNNNISNISSGNYGTAIKVIDSSCRISNNLLKNINYRGIWLDGNKSKRSVISNNSISTAGNGIITIGSVESNIISCNDILSCTSYGVSIGTNGYYNTVTDNNILSCGTSFSDGGTLTTSKGNNFG